MARQLRGLITRVERGEIEMVTPITGERDEEGRWTEIDLRVIDTNGDESTYKIRDDVPISTLARLRGAIDTSGTSYLTTPSLDLFNIFLDEDEWDEFDDYLDDYLDDFKEEGAA